MIAEITETLTRLQREYPISVTSSGKKRMEFSVDGITDEFWVSVNSGDCIVGANAWHEHVGDAEGLEDFLHLLFTGTIQIEVTYRGNTAVGHHVRRLKDGKEETMTRTGSLISPFWKRKSYKKLDYRPANIGSEATSQ